MKAALARGALVGLSAFGSGLWKFARDVSTGTAGGSSTADIIWVAVIGGTFTLLGTLAYVTIPILARRWTKTPPDEAETVQVLLRELAKSERENERLRKQVRHDDPEKQH